MGKKQVAKIISRIIGIVLLVSSIMLSIHYDKTMPNNSIIIDGTQMDLTEFKRIYATIEDIVIDKEKENNVYNICSYKLSTNKYVVQSKAVKQDKFKVGDVIAIDVNTKDNSIFVEAQDRERTDIGYITASILMVMIAIIFLFTIPSGLSEAIRIEEERQHKLHK
jgi:hypothetical protein